MAPISLEDELQQFAVGELNSTSDIPPTAKYLPLASWEFLPAVGILRSLYVQVKNQVREEKIRREPIHMLALVMYQGFAVLSAAYYLMK